MWKIMLAGTAALTLVGASLLYAQTPPPPDRDAGPRFFRPMLTPDQRDALTDARIAGLKAGLKLTPEQEKLWPAVEAALRERAKLRSERIERFIKLREQRRIDPSQRGDVVERMKQRADDMAQSAATMKRLADAIEPLYKSLDDSQKQRFALLYRMGGERRHFWFRGREGGPEMGPPQRGPGRQGPDRRQRRTELDL
ncbi:MAG TPA: Spy/CpxP family protein refolding chaperone [Xanthobacteraceae bacterium]|nr:Spy/CpxP family protein refolding chaperone [Xanthobacteraceae bacterium]